MANDNDEGHNTSGGLRLFTSAGKWIKHKALPGSDSWGQLNLVTENSKALPFFISLHEVLPVVIKNPVSIPVSLHFRSLSFILRVFVPVWGPWVLPLPQLTRKERGVCDTKWSAQVTQTVRGRVWKESWLFFLHSPLQPLEKIPAKGPEEPKIQPLFLPWPEP